MFGQGEVVIVGDNYWHGPVYRMTFGLSVSYLAGYTTNYVLDHITRRGA